MVRTRRVRAIDERYYGRTARMFYVGVGQRSGGDPLPLDFNDFEVAAKESSRGLRGPRAGGVHPARPDPAERRSEFWQRAMELVHEFDQLPRSGDTVYGFVLGIYPTDYPMLPRTGDKTTQK